MSAAKLSAGGEEEGDASAAGEAVAKARGKLVSAMMKKHLVESVVPVMVEIRRQLVEARHPLLGALMAALAALLKVRGAGYTGKPRPLHLSCDCLPLVLVAYML